MILPLHPQLCPLGQFRAFSPAQIPGLRLWLRADAISGLADGAAVATWPDDSGNAMDAAQATAANRPTYRTNVVNGRPVVRFDGADDRLATPAVALGPFTVFTVFRATAGIVYEHNTYAGPGTPGSYTFSTGGAHFDVRRGTLVTQFNVTTALNDNAWRVVAQRYDGTNAGHQAFLNGSAAARSTTFAADDPGTTPVTFAVNVGGRGDGTLPLAGDVAEVLAYDAALAAADRQRVEAFLAAKYGLSLP